MAFEVGAIKGVFQLNDQFTKPMLSIYNSTTKTLEKIKEIPAQVSKTTDQIVKSSSRVNNTLDGLKDRAQRLENLLGKAQLGSDRFKLLQNELQKTNAQIDATTSKFSGLGSVIAGIGFGFLARNIVNASAKFEKYNAVLTNTLGSQKQANEQLEMLQKLASQTPFTLDELTASYIKFVNRGINPTKEELIALGDIAASQGKSFNQLTEAILDATSGEFERLKEFGIRASKSGDQVQLAFKGINLQIAKTPQAIQEALISFGKMNGVTGSMASISSTLEGRFSNLDDATMALSKTIGDVFAPIVKTVTNGLISMIESIVRFAREFPNFTRFIVLGATAFVGFNVAMSSFKSLAIALPPLIRALGLSISLSLGPASVAFIAVSALVGVFALLEDAQEKAKRKNRELADTFASIGAKANPKGFQDGIKSLEALQTRTALTKKEFQDLEAKLNKVGISLKEFATTNGKGVQQYQLNQEALGKVIARLKEQTPAVNTNTGAIKTNSDAIDDNTKKKNQNQNQTDENTESQSAFTKSLNDAIPKMGDFAEIVGKAVKTTGVDLADAFKGVTDALAMMGGKLGFIGNLLGGFAGSIGGVLTASIENFFARLNNNLANIQLKIRQFQTIQQVWMARMQEANQKELDDFQKQQDAELDIIRSTADKELKEKLKAIDTEFKARQKALNARFDAEKKAIEDSTKAEQENSNKRLATITNEFLQRRILLDSEFALKQEQAKSDFERLVESERAKFDETRARIERESTDEEQKQIAIALLEEDWRQHRINLEEQQNERLVQMASEKSQADRTINEEENIAKEEERARFDAAMVALQESNATALLAIEERRTAAMVALDEERAQREEEAEKKKAEAIAKAEAEKEERIQKKRDEIRAREKEENRKIAFIRYMLDVAAMKVQQQIARAQLIMQHAQGVMSAIAQAPATFGASLALLPLMHGTFQFGMSRISAMQVVPPAELFLNSGGRIVPGGGVSDSVSARLTPGEMVVDRVTTDGLQAMVRENNYGNPKGIIIQFMPGAIQNNGQMDERAMDQLSFILSRRLEREYNR